MDQQASRRYWESNLDPQNLGSARARRDLRREWAFYFSDEQRFACSRMPPLRGALCLEIGAGLGAHALWLAAQGAEVVVLDFSGARLAALRRDAREAGLADRLRCVQGAAEALPFPPGAFDLIYTKSTLIHTRLAEALAEANRALAPAGRAIFVEPLDSNPFANLYRRFFAPQEWKRITRYFDQDAIRAVESAFGAVESRPFYWLGFFSFVWQFGWPCLALFRSGQTILRLVDGLLFRLIPPLRRRAWFQVFVCRRK